jgi:lipopolysaccharide transport system permease protein
MTQPFTQYWWLALSLTKRDLAQRYRGTALGLIWPFLYAGLLLLVFTFVFTEVLRVRWPSGPDALPNKGALMILAGLIPYLFIAEVLTRSPSCITSVPNFVKKVRFPLALLPAIVVASSAALSSINALVLVLAVLAFWTYIPATALLLPLLFIPLFFLALGTAYLLAALGVFFRDLAQITPLFAQILMFLAPICYPIEQVPRTFARVINWNPLTWFVNAVRSLVFDGASPPVAEWIEQTLLWFIFAGLGYLFFNKTRRMFADLL